MAESRSWLESRHLGRSDDGRAALAAFDDLPDNVRDAIVETGDALAAHSVSLAHAYFVSAARLARDDGGALPGWQAVGQHILGADGAGRAAAQSYFRLDPLLLCAAPAELRDALGQAVADLVPHSKRLATTFAEVAGALAGATDRPDVEQLRAWRRNVAAAAASGRWRGEFLATRLAETAATLAPHLSPAAVDAWATAFVEIGSAGRSARPPAVPGALLGLQPDIVDSTLTLCADLAAVRPAAGARTLEVLPVALASLPDAGRPALVEAARLAADDEGLADALGFVAALSHGLDRHAAVVGLELLTTVARDFTPGVVPCLRTLDRAWEEGGEEGVRLWIARGIEIGSSRRDAGVAHFRLETRTAHKMLVKHSAAVGFDEVEAMLQRYLIMMARSPVHLTSGAGIWLRPPLAAPDEKVVRLPEKIDLYSTSEENQLFYKLAAAHAAGRWQYGTYDFRLSRLVAEGDETPTDAPAGEDIIALIESFPNPLLAAGLFVALDGVRVDAALEREFAGLAADLDRLGRAYVRDCPPIAADRTGEAIIEALFLMSVGRLTPTDLPAAVSAHGHVLAPVLDRLRDPGATVYDSVRLLISLYGRLALASARGPAEDDGDALIEMGGATIIDLMDHLEASDSVGPALGSEGDDVDNSALDRDVDVTDDQVSLELDDTDGPASTGGAPLSAEEIRKLIEQGVDLRISEAHAEEQAALGLYITELMGKLPAEAIDRLRRMIDEGDSPNVRAWLAEQRGSKYRYYDEWDHVIADYRHRWCRLCELEVDGDGGRYFNGVLSRSAELVQNVKREFMQMRPEQFRKVRGMEDGEEFDMNALVDAHADRRTRRTPSDRLYVARRREERDVATLFLLDMSASTDEPLPVAHAGEEPRRVIDVTKDTLVVMSSVLDEIGDAYAIYGFSGHGREGVEYFHVKTFNERLGPTVRARLGGIAPKRSTRMGAALRHSATKLTAVSARARHLILLSDGFPQDYDYGDDRKSNVYGIRDTTTALQELETQGVQTFCITVDPAGHDYLADMCPASRYAVIGDVASLPEELPRIYRTITRY